MAYCVKNALITRFPLKIIIIIIIIITFHNIVRVIKSRRLRWAGHVPRMEEGRSAFKILTDKSTGKTPLGRA